MHIIVKWLSIVVGVAAVLLGGYWKFVSSETNTKGQNLDIGKNSLNGESMVNSK